MAARENTGLHIALILFVFIIVALGVSTYMTFRSAEEQYKKRVAADAAKQQAEMMFRKSEEKVKALKYMIGFGEITERDLEDARAIYADDAEMKAIDEKYKSDMSIFEADFANGRKCYTNLPNYLMNAMRTANLMKVAAIERATALENEKKEVEKREIARATQAQKEAERVSNELAQARTEFTTQRQTFVTETNRVQEELAKKGSQIDVIQSEAKAARDKLEKDLTFQRNLVEQQAEKLKKVDDQDYESPDGEVTFVNQREKVVYINLGSANGLQRQITFGVYDAKQSKLKDAKKKADVEVTEIIGPNLARARILGDSNTNLILTGDKVHSVTWQPGRQVQFALAGFIDINGDGKSDRVLVRSLINQKGGVIDAEVGDDGSMTGKLSINTKYLVLGERPTDQSGPDAIKGYTTMIEEGRRLAIERLSLEKFLSMMGYRGESNTVMMNKAATGASSKPTDGVNRKAEAGDKDRGKVRQAPPSDR